MEPEPSSCTIFNTSNKLDYYSVLYCILFLNIKVNTKYEKERKGLQVLSFDSELCYGLCNRTLYKSVLCTNILAKTQHFAGLFKTGHCRLETFLKMCSKYCNNAPFYVLSQKSSHILKIHKDVCNLRTC